MHEQRAHRSACLGHLCNLWQCCTIHGTQQSKQEIKSKSIWQDQCYDLNRSKLWAKATRLTKLTPCTHLINRRSSGSSPPLPSTDWGGWGGIIKVSSAGTAGGRGGSSSLRAHWNGTCWPTNILLDSGLPALIHFHDSSSCINKMMWTLRIISWR